MTYILIAWIYSGKGGAALQMQQFTGKAQCEAARAALIATKPTYVGQYDFKYTELK